MRNLRPLLVATLLACFTLCGCQREPHIEVSHARSGALPPTATVGAAYMRIESTTPDELLSAETPVARNVEFHTTQNSNGMMQMRELHQLLIEPGQPLEFSPGANHMMLMGLRQPLSAGSTFPLTLHFKTAGNVVVSVQVRNDLGE
jgi:periplasmic copper chaperone A